MPPPAFFPAAAPAFSGLSLRNALGLPSRGVGRCLERPGARGYARQRPRLRMVLQATEVDEGTFEQEVLQADVPVLVDFYAAWCGPCGIMAPLMDWIAVEFDGKLKVVKVDTDKNESFVGQYDIHGLPTLGIFHEGQTLALREGALGKDDLKAYVKQHVPSLA